MPQEVAGAIATSDPRATSVGAEVLREGGNCVDAAIAAALVLFVVEPHHCGPGGDAFALVQLPGTSGPEALDGAGAVPARLARSAEGSGGPEPAAPFGAASVTVPGAPALLEVALERWGTRKLADLVGPATRYAADGFEVRPSLADACAGATKRLVADPVLAELYTRSGVPVSVGERVVNPALAALLEELASDGSARFYRGPVAEAIADVVDARGGHLDAADMAGHETLDMAPSSTEFAGATVWELPEPTQGPAVLGALRRLRDTDPDDWTAVTLALTAGLGDVGVDLVGAPWRRPQGGTSHLAVVDGEGGMASLITSVFAPFGSGVGVPALGGPLQNRAAGFLLLDAPPAPGKPPHTIIPGLVTRDGEPELALGVAGGLMQAQGQVQLLLRLLARGEPVGDAVAAPRLRVIEGGELALEPGHPLADRHPQAVGRPPGDGGFGCAQVVARVGGRTSAAADHRRGGEEEVVRIE